MNSDRPAHSHDSELDDLGLDSEVPLGASTAIERWKHPRYQRAQVVWLDEDELPGRSFEQLEVLSIEIPPPAPAPVPFLPGFCSPCQLGGVGECAPWCGSQVPDDSDKAAAAAALSECSPERRGRPIPLERAPARSRAAGGNRPKGEQTSEAALDFVALHLGVESCPPRSGGRGSQ